MSKQKKPASREMRILPSDPRWPLTAAKEPGPDAKVADQDKFILRLPAGMRERIKTSASRNRRSMNTEIIYALEALYPPEPDIFDVLERVHRAIAQSKHAGALPYRELLVTALDEFSERITSGLEFDQFRGPHIGPMYDRSGTFMDRFSRWKRVQEVGVEQSDLEREIARGLLRNMRGDGVRQAIMDFERGKPLVALRLLRLHEVKFVDSAAAYAAIEADLRKFYEENWGDINDVPPWDEED